MNITPPRKPTNDRRFILEIYCDCGERLRKTGVLTRGLIVDQSALGSWLSSLFYQMEDELPGCPRCSLKRKIEEQDSNG